MSDASAPEDELPHLMSSRREVQREQDSVGNVVQGKALT